MASKNENSFLNEQTEINNSLLWQCSADIKCWKFDFTEKKTPLLKSQLIEYHFKWMPALAVYSRIHQEKELISSSSEELRGILKWDFNRNKTA